ncbi:MAG: hypothetical protein HOM80_11680 [Bacteroidetes bacterium]|nr:hypothetical protein [Bacteroidota bacterium]
MLEIEKNNTVLIEVDGSESRLLEFISWCKNGPTNAEVQEVEWNESEIIGFITFDIKHKKNALKLRAS